MDCSPFENGFDNGFAICSLCGLKKSNEADPKRNHKLWNRQWIIMPLIITSTTTVYSIVNNNRLVWLLNHLLWVFLFSFLLLSLTHLCLPKKLFSSIVLQAHLLWHQMNEWNVMIINFLLIRQVFYAAADIRCFGI